MTLQKAKFANVVWQILRKIFVKPKFSETTGFFVKFNFIHKAILAEKIFNVKQNFENKKILQNFEIAFARKICYNENKNESGGNVAKILANALEENKMKIAVCFSKEDGKIFQHFGHTKFFKFYEITDGKISASEIVDVGGAGHEALADFLKAHEVSALVCGGVGGGAVAALNSAQIEIYAGNSGAADEAAQLLAEGKLQKNSSANCNHHGEHHSHHEQNHGGQCGEVPKLNLKLF